MGKTTVVMHNGTQYSLQVGGWLRHLHSRAEDAIKAIAVDEIILPDDQTKAGVYKGKAKVEYDAKPGLAASYKQYLNACFQRDFGMDWDEYIGRTSALINERTIPLLMPDRTLDTRQQREVLLAASNGHVAAMYWIGTGLRGIQDDHCLRWLSMAHNCGHVGASYEMALHLASKGNHLDALRCLIVSADGGSDIAYLSIFHISVMHLMLKVERAGQAAQLEAMFEGLADEAHASCARYLKGVLRLLQGRAAEGRRILDGFSKQPRKKPSAQELDSSYDKQTALVHGFIAGLLADLESGANLLNALEAREEQKLFIGFHHYEEMLSHLSQHFRSAQEG